METQTPVRILVAWFRFGVNGSIARFVRFAAEAERLGHRVDFVSLTGETRREWPSGPEILGPDSLAGGRWDAVMVPGAGNPKDPLPRLELLRHPRFGRRIQHVLNDTARLDRFVAVNDHLAPDTVVFNNSAWSPAAMRRLLARAFHVLPGAVDSRRFRPAPAAAARRDRFHLGAYSRKNLELVLDALAGLPPDVVLHVFGGIPGELAARTDALLARGRLVPAGDLFDDALARWYRDLDAFVAVETSAGWCNPAAEAMASGLPCVVGRAGTLDFAEAERNALVVEPRADAIAAAVRRLRDDPARARDLGQAAAATMRRFDWADWSARLLDIATAKAPSPYYRVPELGLHGKWDPAERCRGLEPLLSDADDARVLDLGAAEGLVSAALADAGARVVHAFELDEGRVRVAGELLASRTGTEAVVRRADLSDWDAFTHEAADVLLPRYDVVLFLGIYHHLPAGARDRALDGALARAGRWFAVRTPPDVARHAALADLLRRKGWALHSEREGDDDTGWLGLFRRDAVRAKRARPQPAAREATR